MHPKEELFCVEACASMEPRNLLKPVLARRAVLAAGGLGALTAGFGAVNLRAATPTTNRDLKAVPILTLSPPSHLFAQYVAANGENSISSCCINKIPSPCIERFAWDWGDGTPTSIGSITYHYYRNPGTFTVTLTVSEGTASSSATAVIDVPPPQPVPSTLELSTKLQRELSRILPPDSPESSLAIEAKKLVDQAVNLSGGSDSEQLEAVALYAAAGELFFAMDNLLRTRVLDGSISSVDYQSLALEGVAPVLVSLNKNGKELLTSLAQPISEVAHPAHGGSVFRRFAAFSCRRICDATLGVIDLAIAGAGATGALVCSAAAEIPPLAAACGTADVILVGAAAEAALNYHDGCYEDCAESWG